VKAFLLLRKMSLVVLLHLQQVKLHLDADTTQVAKAAAAPIKEAGQKAGKTIVGAMTKPAETVRADVAFNLGMEELNKAYEFLYPKISRPVSTIALASGQLTKGELPNIPQSWELAKDVSPGQAVAATYVPLFNQYFNLADPTDRKETFQKNIFGKVASGSLDGFLNWYADPLVLAGKGAAAARKNFSLSLLKQQKMLLIFVKI
jgi:hypothetical protein